MAATPEQISAQRRIAANKSWAQTPNRRERTANGYKASPLSLDYWIAKTREDGIVEEPYIEAAAASAHRAYRQEVRSRGVRKAEERKAAAQAQQLQRTA